jgi:hypothetical protein
MMNLGFFSPLLPSVDAIMAGCPRVGPRTSSSVSLSRRCRPARVRARVVCLPGVEWRGVGVLLYETRGRFPPR